MPLRFDNSYAKLPQQFYEKIAPTPVANPTWVAKNEELGELLGLEPAEWGSPDLLRALAGNGTLPGAEPIALAYAGHQFGGFVPKLGDGRAILLGEVIDRDGQRRDVQLKGSGPTSFSRRGDGRAALGPVLREFLVSEAMFTLGVPTTRSLAAVSTGEPVYRETTLPGAVLTRVASSHLRVGTFEYFGRRGDATSLRALVTYAMERHALPMSGESEPALALLNGVIAAQAKLVAKWMNLGFVHGVMNTDNCSISGETIDYGPCAFLDTFDPERTFSSIDSGGRYAYENQPRIALWNMARFAEALLPLLGDVTPTLIGTLEERLGSFMPLFESEYGVGLCAKLGLSHSPSNVEFAQKLLDLMQQGRVDFTLAFRRLTQLAGDGADEVTELFGEQPITPWLLEWRNRTAREASDAVVRRMAAVNPVFIPRNHRVEEAIAAANAGDLAPFERLRSALRQPFIDQDEFADLATPPGEEQWDYCTFCGT